MDDAANCRSLEQEEVKPLMHSLDVAAPRCSSDTRHHTALLGRVRGQLRKLTPELIAIALVYFVQGILRLSSLALTFFEKDDLKMEPAQMAVADTIAGLPWAIKPLYGIISDSLPIFGRRRRPYLMLTGLLGSLSWVGLALLARGVPSTIACITLGAAATAFSDVVADSLVVELARANPGSTEGALQSLCWASHAFGRLITAYLSGWLVGKIGPRMVFLLTASFPLVVCLSSCLINEKAAKPGKQSENGDDQQQSEMLLRSPASPGALQQFDVTPASELGAAPSKIAGVSAAGSALAGTSAAPGHEIRRQQHLGGRLGSGDAADDYAARGLASGAQGCLRQLLGGVHASAMLLLNAVRQPHVLRPVAFLFLWQAMPAAGTAMFYFKTNKLGFDAEYFGRVKLVAALADLFGIFVYNSRLKTARLRPTMLWGSLLGCALGLTPLMLVEGLNRRLGISDRLFALVDSALLSSISQVLMMPTLVLAARLCPEGVEATLYASLMSLNNAAVATSDLAGAWMMKGFGITSTNFDHLATLLFTCNMLSLLPLPLIRWVPDESAAAAAAVHQHQQQPQNQHELLQQQQQPGDVCLAVMPAGVSGTPRNRTHLQQGSAGQAGGTFAAS